MGIVLLEQLIAAHYQVHKISIIPRLGYTYQLSTEDQYPMTRGKLLETEVVEEEEFNRLLERQAA